MTFRRQHASMLLRYSGISFVSGAVNHGFFSGERSLWTAAAGVVLFALAFHAERDPQRDRAGEAWRTLGWSALLSVGLGFFTGGLQHFPDSPDRSAWVVPLGFVLSVLALVRLESVAWSRPLLRYAGSAGLATVAGSVVAWQLLAGGMAGTHLHAEGAGDVPVTAVAVDRVVEVAMGDDMRFDPPSLQVRAGETVRLALTNRGQLEHELVIGTSQQLQAHAREMAAGQGHAHGGAGLTLPPGGRGELVVTFRQAGTLDYACLIPGHLEAGMRGSVVVAQTDAAAAPAAAPGHPPSAPAHRH